MKLKKTMFIGQAMPRAKRNHHDWPTLNNWLHLINISDDQIRQYFYYSALVAYFPGAKNGSHLVPTAQEIAKEQSRLKRQMFDFKPQVVVSVGKLSAQYCLQEEKLLLTGVIGNKYVINPYGLLDKELVVIPLPHPSGASTWTHGSANKKLLTKALKMLKSNIVVEN